MHYFASTTSKRIKVDKKWISLLSNKVKSYLKMSHRKPVLFSFSPKYVICKFDVYSCKLPIRYLFTIISWTQNTNKCKHRNRILFCHSIHSTSRSLKQVQFSIPMHIAKFSIHMTPEHVFAASYRALQISRTPSEILIKVKKKNENHIWRHQKWLR